MQYLKYSVLPIILGIFMLSCEKDDPSVIDPILNIPSISNQTFTPSTIDSDTINAVATVEVASVDPIRQVSVIIYNPSNSRDTVFYLKDNGVAPDVTAGDGIYSGRVFYRQGCRLVGSWRADFIAETDAGLFSNTNSAGFTVINSNNRRPGIADLICPDSLRRPSGVGGDTVNFAFLQLRGTDPDGSCNVKDAYFNSFSPSGFPNQFNPFLMYDDGNILLHGDTVAGDKKYSLIVKIVPNSSDTSIGNYTFKFNTNDHANPPAVSDTLTKIITIYR